MVKRILDFILSLAFLLLLCPLILLIAIGVRLSLGAPVLFRQERPGYRGRFFFIYKFRTMTEERNTKGELLPDAQRLPSFGKWLRLTSMDELPQLFNVLKGDLSFVGPRPLLVEYLPLYSEEQSRRHDVKPGITGWAQVNGRNAVDWPKRLAMDVWYVDHRSFLLDLKILWMTMLKVAKREGVSAQGHATVPKFTGNGTKDERL
jgi:lipopolysaccharide/colanic/teichoic acid biosynthesis glycosyltransferase